MQAQTNGETGRRGGMVVTLKGPPAAKEVDSDETGRLDDVEETITVLKGSRYTRQRHLKEVRLQR